MQDEQMTLCVLTRDNDIAPAIQEIAFNASLQIQHFKDASQYLDFVQHCHVDLEIIDYEFTGSNLTGIDVARIREQSGSVNPLVFFVQEDSTSLLLERVVEFKRLRAIVSKSTTSSELVDILELLKSGEFFVSPQFENVVVINDGETNLCINSNNAISTTAARYDVWLRILLGDSDKSVSAFLTCSAKNMRNRLYGDIGAHNVADAFQIALQQKVFTLKMLSSPPNGMC